MTAKTRSTTNIVSQNLKIYDPGSIYVAVVCAAVTSILDGENKSISPELRQKAKELIDEINAPETPKKPDPGCGELTSDQMAKMVKALIQADPTLCDVAIHQNILGQGELNGSTEMTESNLQRIIDRERKPILTAEQAHQRINSSTGDGEKT